MARETTISTHGSSHRPGTRANQAHNVREPGITDHEPHISQGGHYEVWVHEDAREAYARIFGEALAEYNARTRPARQIPDYLEHLQEKVRQYDERVAQLKEAPEQSVGRDGQPKTDKNGKPVMKKAKPPVQPVRELIVGVYRDVDQEDARAVLQDYLASFKARNPNLEVIGAYYHADEDGQPGLHLDYIPVSRKHGGRGLSVQNNMEEALREQGIKPTGKQTQTALQQWTQAENAYLESLVLQRGREQGKDYAVIHPQAGKHSRHLPTQQYKLQQEAQKQQAQQAALDTQAEAQAQAAQKIIDDRAALDAQAARTRLDNAILKKLREQPAPGGGTLYDFVGNEVKRERREQMQQAQPKTPPRPPRTAQEEVAAARATDKRVNGEKRLQRQQGPEYGL